jgi:HlyD family secretion protein
MTFTTFLRTGTKALWALSMLLALAGSANAAIEATAGPYRVRLTSQPRTVAIGQMKLIFAISDASGKPLEGLQVKAIAGMPGMFMGERETAAVPISGKAGRYSMQAAFPMAGLYDVKVNIKGPLGEANGVFPVRTGQDLGEEAAGFSVWSLLPWFGLAAIAIFVLARMRATGQRFDAKAVLNRGTVLGVLLMAGMLALGVWAVNNLRRDGATTPLEAQVMEMHTPAPPGTSAVELATAVRQPISETVRYTGQAVGFVEQDVVPRVTGTVVSMSVYVGDLVKKGQMLARLDTSQIDPELAERAAMTDMAIRGVDVAATEYRTSLAEVAEARAELSVKEGMVQEAESMIEAARQEKAAMEADVESMQSGVQSAQAEIEATQAAATYASDELGRMQRLFDQKAISRSELQQAERENADAMAKHSQARQMLREAESKVNSARANVRKSDAMVAAAQRRLKQAQGDVRASRAAIRAREAAAEAAKKNIGKERAGVAQAQAGYRGAATQRGYSELKAEVDGVVTKRLISPGVTVSPGQALMKVAQVSPIRLQANVASADLERIQIGGQVSIRAASGDSSPIKARISSISPAVDPGSRTGVVEVLWPNSDRRFSPGQFVSMEIELGSSRLALVVPRGAIQSPPGTTDQPFVWVAKLEGEQLIARRTEVRTGVSDGEGIEITEGLDEGQRVVTQGGAYLREGGTIIAPKDEVAAKGPVIEVSATGFSPSSIEIESGKPTTITFIRISEEGCGTEVLFPDLKINQPLPLNKPVPITITPKKPGELKFSCGMDMMKGKVIVR